MSNTIPPFSQTQTPEPMGEQGGPVAPSKPNKGSGTASPQTEAVTLSEAAQTGTQLFAAASESNGVDQASVEQIRGALASGNYNVSPDDLAQAIATVLKETNQ
jgi:flagellar biosynthesis anti-sigma factor FlgM